MPGLIEANGILFKKWEAKNPKAAILFVHGLGAHTGRWEFAADFFVRHKYNCYGLALKGYGESREEPKGHIDSFKTYYRDIITLRKIIEKENPGLKIFLTAESLGALIAFQDTAGFSGLILISPAFQNRMRFTIIDYLLFPLMLLFNPKHLYKTPITPEICSSDRAYQETMKHDPRETHFVSTKTLFNALITIVISSFTAKNINLPVLFLLAGNDQLVNPDAAENVFKNIKIADKTLIRYPQMLHVLHCELEREKVFRDILEWLEKRK